MNKKEIRKEIISEGLYHIERDTWLFSNQEIDLIVDKIDAKINFVRCCETLKVKDLMTFKDYKNNLFIKAYGVYQPKKTKLFVWYSEKQLKKMYKGKSL